MEQRVYRTTVQPETLADVLVRHIDPQEHLQAQRIGEGDSCLVQIGQGDTPAEYRPALTVTIAYTEDESGPMLVVTQGQQTWLNPKMAGYTAVVGLVGILITPLALFGMLWPMNEAVRSMNLTSDVWNQVDVYLVGAGGHLEDSRTLQHPHTI